MLEVVSALSFLAALSGFGVVVLRRSSSNLTTLESVAYGAPLGTVLGTLLILLVARVVGLTAATVTVGAAAFFALVVSLARPTEVRSRRVDAAEVWARIGPTLTSPAVWLPVAVLCLVLLRWAFFWVGALTYSDEGLAGSHVNMYGDLAVHLGNATTFAYGDNFPPQHPRFAGYPLAYHHLSDLTAAALIPMGLDPGSALMLHSAVFSVFTALAIFVFALRLSRDAIKASLALLLFVLSGSLGWLVMLPEIVGSADPLGGRLWAFDLVKDQGYDWQNMFYGFLMPQRAFLYGMPIALLSLTWVLVAHRRASTNAFLAAGAVLGLLPLAHLGSMLAMAIITPFLVLLFPSRRWIYFFAAWILIALPQLFLQQGGGAGALAFIRIQLGWVMEDVAWPIFWLKQVGLFLPLVLVALALPRLLPRDSYRLLVAFMGIFVIANIVVFQPWDWDNHKILVYWFFATCILVSSLLVWAWRRYGTMARGLIAVGIVSMVLSGVLEDVNQLLGRSSYSLFTADDIALAIRVRDETPKDAVFVAAPQNNNPVPALAGRRVVMGYWGWLFAEGLPWEERQADLEAIYAFTDGAEQLLAKYGVDYVVIGPPEMARMAPNVTAFRNAYPTVIKTDTYEVFAIND